MPRLSLAALAACVAAASATARANGRFPLAQHVLVGPTAREASTIVLRTTFGLMVSRDGGRTFDWVCEEALEFAGQWDPAIALTADGAVHAGLPDGLIQTSDLCAFRRPPGVGAVPVGDLANDPAGEAVLAVEAATGVPNHVLLSTDRGATFRALGPGVAGVAFLTADAAPSNPARVYVTGVDDATRAPRLYRSDDRGATLTPVTPLDLLGGTDAYLAGVDARDADRIWVRANRGEGTLLLRSDDAGSRFARAAETTGPMLGFALADDGVRVWIGGPDDGLLRSDDGGQTFRRVADLQVTCLRHHAGALYVCTNWLAHGYTLAVWRDADPSPVPLLYFDDVRGAAACAAGSVTREVCAARWPAQRELVRRRDAGLDAQSPLDARAPGDAAELDAGAMDAAALHDASPNEPVRPPGACACRAAAFTVPARDSVRLVALLGGALLGLRRRARRRRAR